MIPVFIVYQPRSGSTLLVKMLRQHPEMLGLLANEVLYFLSIKENAECHDNEIVWDNLMRNIGMQRLMGHLDEGQVRDKFISGGSKTVKERYEFIINEVNKERGAKYIIDKSIRNALIMDKILRLWDNSKIIYIARDPRAITFSRLNKVAANSMGKSTSDISEKDWKYSIKDIFVMSYGVNENIKKMESFAKKAPSQRFLTIKYEDLIKETECVLKQICAFLGVEYHQEMNAYYIHDKFSTNAHALLNSAPRSSQLSSFKQLSKNSLYIINKATLKSQSYKNYEEIKVVGSILVRIKYVVLAFLIKGVQIRNRIKGTILKRPSESNS